MVAAGGGGDALAAVVIAAATPDRGRAVGVATLAWDRLAVDPLPGPRGASDFDRLDQRGGYSIVTASTVPRPPAGSTLPRLATALSVPLVLLDPAGGAEGIRSQVTAATRGLGGRTVELVDVGGDLLGAPGDPGLRSPLADALTAAACPPETSVYVVGPGLDGELAEALVLDRLTRPPVLTLTAADWVPLMGVFAWHPTEATALLAAASRGLRGMVEIRDAGLPVLLTDDSPKVSRLRYADVTQVNPLVDAIATTQSFAGVERVVRKTLGWTELDYERDKASRPAGVSAGLPAGLNETVTAWEAAARGRGVDWATFRRIAEAAKTRAIAELREHLISAHPDRYDPPLWRVRR
jgi:hypothetical protein